MGDHCEFNDIVLCMALWGQYVMSISHIFYLGYSSKMTCMVLAIYFSFLLISLATVRIFLIANLHCLFRQRKPSRALLKTTSLNFSIVKTAKARDSPQT